MFNIKKIRRDIALIKERKIMKLPFACELYSDGGEVSNPFSGEKCKLTADALSVYDTIKGAE